jgi:DNA-binding transcriptional LysR family regulator
MAEAFADGARQREWTLMQKDPDAGLFRAMGALVRVAESGSFTTAAKHLGLTTAQVSRLVSRLEARLQTKILQRTTRRLALTAAGELYVKRCKDMLELVRQAEDEARGSSAQPTGRLCISGPLVFGDRYLAPIVAEYCARYPTVTVEYRASQYFPDIVRDGIDVAVYIYTEIPDSTLISQRLGTVVAILCASPDYVASHGAPDHPDGLVQHSCLSLENPAFGTRCVLTDGVTTLVATLPGPLVGETPEVLVQGALRGVGIAVLPTYVAIDYLRQGRLVRVLPGWQSVDYGIHALIPSRQFLGLKARIDLLCERIPPALVRDQLPDHLEPTVSAS